MHTKQLIHILLIAIMLTACKSEQQAASNAKTVIDKPSAVSVHGSLQVSGNKLLDQHGEPVQLRGMSLFWSQWMGQFYTPEVVRWLKQDWHCNVVRAAMAVEREGYLSNPEVEKQKVYTVIEAAIEEGIYVIVDWHSHHAEDQVEEAQRFFSEVAQRYGRYPNIIYEPYNEPLQDVSWSEVIKPYHQQVIAAIRAYDLDNLIICGTRTWSQDVDEVIGDTLDDNNVAYTLHYYAATHKQSLRDKAQKALDNGIPIFVTEFGVSEASGDDSIDAEEARTWWDFLEQHQISWCNWSVADKEELSAALKPGASGQGGWPLTQITTSGTMVRKEIRAKNPTY